MHQHIPAQWLKQSRAPGIQRILDGGMEGVYQTLLGIGKSRYRVRGLNIAHTEDDIWNPKGNAKSSGFLPQEREWFTQLLSDGWHDAFRGHVGEGEKIYSWWSNRGQARALNRGWRIDYFLLNPVAAAMIKDVQIIRQGGIDVSDHAPVMLDLDF